MIAAIGVFGLCLAGLRAFILQRAGRERYEQAAQELHDSKTLTVSCRPIQQLMDSQSDSHDTLMDLAETIVLQEKSRLERFGTAILVIAAVAPLLGLLGTVTGMIGTFEMITEHGTGDPKMLSGGISEALITTQLGLVVAIPMVLLGNALNTWSSRILSRLEAGILLAVATRSEERIEHAIELTELWLVGGGVFVVLIGLAGAIWAALVGRWWRFSLCRKSVQASIR